MFDKIHPNLFEEMINGDLDIFYDNLTAEERFKFASTLESERLFFIKGKKVSRVVHLSNFQTIVLRADNLQKQEAKFVKEQFTLVFDEFLS